MILPDNDLPGKGHAELVALSLHGLAARIRVVELPDLPPKGDVTDWVRAGGTASELRELVERGPGLEARERTRTLPSASMGTTSTTSAMRAGLCRAHGDSIHYVCDRGRWYFWDGRHWAEDQTGEVVRMAKSIVDAMLELAGEAQEEGPRQWRQGGARRGEAVREARRSRPATMVV